MINHLKHKIGIAGFGGAGMAFFRQLKSLDTCVVNSVFDTENSAHERLLTYSDRVAFFNDYETFLSSDISIVIIATPDATHAGYLTRALKANKHVLCEKPLTDSVEGIRSIIKEVNTYKNCVVAVQHQMRFLPVHKKMKQIIKNGELGKISYIEGYYVHNLTERGFQYHDWRKTDKATPLVYSGVHMVDLMRWLVDDEVVEISGMANHIGFPEYPESDLNVVLLKFRSGVIGKVITAFGAARPQDHSVRVYGTEKSIENNMLVTKEGGNKVFHKPFTQLSTLRHQSIRKRLGRLKNYIKPVMLSQLFNSLIGISPRNGDYALQSYPLRVYEHGFAVRESMLDFLNAVENKTQPKCTVMESAKSVATCLAGVEAYRSGKTIKVESYWLKEFE